MQLCELVEWELNMYRLQCNFTDEELNFFNMRAKDCSVEETAEKMDISIGKAYKISRKIKEKMERVL